MFDETVFNRIAANLAELTKAVNSLRHTLEDASALDKSQMQDKVDPSYLQNSGFPTKQIVTTTTGLTGFPARPATTTSWGNTWKDNAFMLKHVKAMQDE